MLNFFNFEELGEVIEHAKVINQKLIGTSNYIKPDGTTDKVLSSAINKTIKEAIKQAKKTSKYKSKRLKKQWRRVRRRVVDNEVRNYLDQQIMYCLTRYIEEAKEIDEAPDEQIIQTELETEEKQKEESSSDEEVQQG